MTSSFDKQVKEAVDFLNRRLPFRPETGIVSGSGLGGIADDMPDAVRIRYADIPHFPVSSVKGHAGEAVAGQLGGKPLMILSGRVHFYEGLPMDTIAFPIKVMAALGVTVLVVTNAAGGINHGFAPGDLVAISGHLNLMQDFRLNPSTGMPRAEYAYDPRLMALADRVARSTGAPLKSGVYAALSGPCYETPAEIRALRIMGADMVGMSTVPEVIAARGLGMKVLGISLITNLAAGMGLNPLSHQEVIDTSTETLPVFKRLLLRIVDGLGSESGAKPIPATPL